MSAESTRPTNTIQPADRRPDLIITGGRLAGNDDIGPVDLSIADGRIAAVEAPGRHRDRQPCRHLDATGLIVAAGFIDLQINGGHGIDLWSLPERLWELADLLPRYGVTAFCPTIVSGPPDRITAALAALADRPADPIGAEPLGLHLEGPMLAAARRGAHDERYLVPPSPSLVEGWTAERGVALATLAPELPGAIEVIERLTRAGVIVSAGHTEATASHAADADEAGLSLVTHLFNAMAPLRHRDPGLIGYTLGSDRLMAGLIVDGIHVDPTVVALALRALGPDRLILVSDAVAAMGLGPGRHRFGRRTVVADDAGVHDPDGTLAGTNLTLDAAVRNLLAFTGCEVDQAIRCATANPARALGIDADRGHLAPGAVADVVLLDEELSVQGTLCRGRVSHLADGAVERLAAATTG